MRVTILPPHRGADCHGAGHFGAPRGSRKHNGVDYACYPGSTVLAQKAGRVTKIGYPYRDCERLRYVQITDKSGYRARYFYVSPLVEVGDTVNAGDIIGKTQELGSRYPDITEHLHYEVIDLFGDYIDPDSYYLHF